MEDLKSSDVEDFFFFRWRVTLRRRHLLNKGDDRASPSMFKSSFQTGTVSTKQSHFIHESPESELFSWDEALLHRHA